MTRKEFDELTEDVKKLRRRVHHLEKEAKEGSAKVNHSASHSASHSAIPAKAEGRGLSAKAEGSGLSVKAECSGLQSVKAEGSGLQSVN